MSAAMSVTRWKRAFGVQIKLDNENRRANLQYVQPKEGDGMETID